MKRDSLQSRAQLVARIRERMAHTGAPRLLLCLIMILAACGAFAASVFALRMGVDSMMLRYPLAVIAGYLTFLVLIRGWIAWHRRSGWVADTAGDVISAIDTSSVSLPSRGGAGPTFFAGGRSGGAGGGDTWSSLATTSRPTGGGGSSANSGFSLDFDEAWPLVLAAVCALGGLLAIIWVIYSAPVLLAEVALDAAIVSALYKRLKKQEMSHWAMTVFRHTWLPAVVLIAFAAVGGWALEKAAPDAVSIGGVVRSLRRP